MYFLEKDRPYGSSRILLIDLLSGNLLWSSNVNDHGPMMTSGIYPQISHGLNLLLKPKSAKLAKFELCCFTYTTDIFI